MKILKITLIAFIATVIFNNTIAAQYVRTVNYSTSTSSNGSALMLSVIKTKMAMEGYNLASDDYFTISENDIKIKNRSFHPNNNYVIIVLPTEDGVNDLDLYMCDSFGNTILKDADNNASAMISYSPYSQCNAVLKIKNQDSNRLGYAYDAHLLIFYK